MGCTIKVEVKGHPGMGGVFPLAPGGSVTGGRSGGCDIVLDDQLIAPTHFRILMRQDTPWIENLDPEFGIFVNGEFIEESAALPPEAEVDVGGVVQLRVAAVMQQPATPPEPAPAIRPEPLAAEPPSIESVPTEPTPIETDAPEHDQKPEPVPVLQPELEPQPNLEPTPSPLPAPIESEPLPPLSPEPAPTSVPSSTSPPPPASAPEPAPAAVPPPKPAGPGFSSKVRPLAEPYLEEFGPDALAAFPAEQLDSFVDRAREMADEHGLPWADSGSVLFRCMALSGSDLSNPSGPAADIVATLALVERSAESRLRRVSKIAERLNVRGPINPLSPEPGTPVTPEPPLPEAPSAPSASTPSTPTPSPPSVPDAEKPRAPKAAPPPPAASPASTPLRAAPAEPTKAPEPVAPARPSVPETTPGGGADPGLPLAERVSFTGYAIDGGLGPNEFSGRDTSTGDRVLIALAEGPASEAHERMLAALPLAHRSIERVENTGVGRADGADRAFVAVRDRGQTPLSSMIDRTSARAMPTLGGDELLSALGFRPEHLAPDLAEAVGASDRGYERLVMLWLADLAEAMQAAHDAGVVHGGLTPACVVLDARGIASMRWLGRYDASACRRDAIDEAVLPSLPPERLAAIVSGVPTPPALRPLGDLWSLGVLGVTLLTGRPPFAGRPAEVVMDIATRDINDPAESTQGVSQSAGRFCLGLMQRDPANRPTHAMAAAEAAREIATGRGSGAKKMLGFLGRKG